ncbi:hypothetical protein B566_EDAN005844 [Ephemera danica]|nr:hypothetical protein B566_EDAN005844 [Ephemera danica]
MSARMSRRVTADSRLRAALTMLPRFRDEQGSSANSRAARLIASPANIAQFFLYRKSAETTDNLVLLDIEKFYKSNFPKDSVLLFPAVNSFRRFLIHKSCEPFEGLNTFSVGEGDGRRTVVCYNEHLDWYKAMNSVAPANNVPQSTHMSQTRRPSSRNMPVVGIYRPPAARLLHEAASVGNGTSNKAGEPPSPSEVAPSPPKPARHRSPNVVTPRKKSNKSEKPETLALADRTPSCDSDIGELSESNEQETINLVPNSCVTTRQLETDVTADFSEEITPPELTVQPEVLKTPEVEVVTPPLKLPCVPPTLKISESPKQKLESSEIKTSLKYSPPGKLKKEEFVETYKTDCDTSYSGKKSTPQASLNIDDCSWDMMFDDNGDCLHPSIMEELTQAVGKVRVARPSCDYSAYETAREVVLAEKDYPHVLEVYGFSAEFKTQDLMAILQPVAGTTGCDLKWVDDTHALAVFSNSQIAAEMLALHHPLVQTRPLSQATAESRQKARRSSQFLQPYRPRPETCTALAKRMVSSALGVRLNTSREEREKERTLLREAREKKRLAAKLSEEAWEGKITSSNKQS